MPPAATVMRSAVAIDQASAMRFAATELSARSIRPFDRSSCGRWPRSTAANQRPSRPVRWPSKAVDLTQRGRGRRPDRASGRLPAGYHRIRARSGKTRNPRSCPRSGERSYIPDRRPWKAIVRAIPEKLLNRHNRYSRQSFTHFGSALRLRGSLASNACM